MDNTYRYTVKVTCGGDQEDADTIMRTIIESRPNLADAIVSFQPAGIVYTGEVGCLLEGHRGWRAIGDVVTDIAEPYGFVVSEEDRATLARFYTGDPDIATDDDHESVTWMSDEAEAWLNDNVAADGYAFGWQDGEFYYWATEVWEDQA